MFTVLIEWGWCRPGYSPGLIAELRLGFCRVAWCHGSLLERVRGWERALEEARTTIRELLGRGRS